MHQTDWLLRQIEMMGDASGRLLAALREHRPEDAIEVSQEAIGELLGTDPALVDVLAPEGLLTLLSAGGSLDVYRTHMLGELLAARAEALAQLGRHTQASADRARARTLLTAALPEAEGADADRIGEVLEWLGTGR
jgi:hypothetical protein